MKTNEKKALANHRKFAAATLSVKCEEKNGRAIWYEYDDSKLEKHTTRTKRGCGRISRYTGTAWRRISKKVAAEILAKYGISVEQFLAYTLEDPALIAELEAQKAEEVRQEQLDWVTSTPLVNPAALDVAIEAEIALATVKTNETDGSEIVIAVIPTEQIKVVTPVMTITTKENAAGRISGYFVDGVKVLKNEIDLLIQKAAQQGKLIEVNYITGQEFKALTRTPYRNMKVDFTGLTYGKKLMTRSAAEDLGWRVIKEFSGSYALNVCEVEEMTAIEKIEAAYRKLVDFADVMTLQGLCLRQAEQLFIFKTLNPSDDRGFFDMANEFKAINAQATVDTNETDGSEDDLDEEFIAVIPTDDSELDDDELIDEPDYWDEHITLPTFEEIEIGDGYLEFTNGEWTTVGSYKYFAAIHRAWDDSLTYVVTGRVCSKEKFFELMAEKGACVDNTSDDFMTELAKLKEQADCAEAEYAAAQDAVIQAYQALAEAKDVVNEADEKRSEAMRAYRQFGEMKAQELFDKFITDEVTLAAGMTIHTQLGHVVAPEILRPYLSFYEDQFIISGERVEYGSYESPAQIEAVMTRLKNAIARGSKEFAFPTVVSLTAPSPKPKAVDDKLAEAMETSLLKCQEQCRRGSLQGALAELKNFAIVRDAIRVWYRTEPAVTPTLQSKALPKRASCRHDSSALASKVEDAALVRTVLVDELNKKISLIEDDIAFNQLCFDEPADFPTRNDLDAELQKLVTVGVRLLKTRDKITRHIGWLEEILEYAPLQRRTA